MVETSLALSPTSDTSLMPLQRMNKNQTLLYVTGSEPGMFRIFFQRSLGIVSPLDFSF